jgi:hypothetical protein
MNKITNVEQLNRILADSVKPEKGSRDRRAEGSITPLEYDPERKIFAGFLMDYTSDCRMRFLFALQSSGFKEVMYEAPYYWSFQNDKFRVEYVEGDVYATDLEGALVCGHRDDHPALSRYGHGDICSYCERKEAGEGDFLTVIKQKLATI